MCFLEIEKNLRKITRQFAAGNGLSKWLILGALHEQKPSLQSSIDSRVKWGWSW